MKNKFLLGFILSVASFIFVFNPGIAYASVNDFVIKDFQADYYLGKDDEGRSTLKTVEQITAEFPNYDQNHGIERAIPLTYDEHGASLNIESVHDQDGQDLNYTYYESNDNIILRIGNADTYVHGQNIYVITYSERDVTKYFSNTKDDEFYWDTNGTGWSQAFESVTARLHIDSDIINSLSGNMYCYYGASGANNSCQIAKTEDIITASQTGLPAGENMTIAVGFNAGTFNQYVTSKNDENGYKYTVEGKEMTYGAVSLFQKYFAIGEIFISIAIIIFICFLRLTKFKSAPSTHAIVPEYLPPKDADAALSSIVLKKSRTWLAATYVDLAVRHKIKIMEIGEKKMWWSKQKYNLELISSDGLSVTEKRFAGALFGAELNIGSTKELNPNKPDYKLGAKITDLYKDANAAAESDGYIKTDDKLKFISGSLTVYLVIQFCTMFFVFSEDGTLYFGEAMIANFLAMLAALVIVFTMKPLSPKGRELHDYLKGLEMYIKVGEEERLKILQSPEGAEKTPVDINDKVKLVHLYERVLPYAVLFGQEKGWTKALGEYYEQHNLQPDWYVGHGAFNAVVFSSMMSDFSAGAVRSSYSAPSSSSSGGSSGGGFSGGGGGGGGGGGW